MGWQKVKTLLTYRGVIGGAISGVIGGAIEELTERQIELLSIKSNNNKSISTKHGTTYYVANIYYICDIIKW